MKTLILIFCLFVALNARRPNYMQCLQDVLHSLDVLNLMGEHLSDNNALALQATAMAFAFDLTRVKESCNMEFELTQKTGPVSQEDCIFHTKKFYEHMQPIMNSPQNVLTDTKAFGDALDSFTDVLSTCGVVYDDLKNQKVEELIEENGGLDMVALANLMNQLGALNSQLSQVQEPNTSKKNSFKSIPGFGSLDLESS